MRTAGNIIMTIGVATFLYFGASDRSNIAAGYVAVVGMFVLYLGYRLEEIADYICWSRNRRQKQRRKHRKVRVWLGRARQII